MITIQIDGKTYKTDSEKPILIHDLYNTLELFGFEEVKENNLMEEDTLEAIKEFVKKRRVSALWQEDFELLCEFIETIEKEARQDGREEMRKECLACIPENKDLGGTFTTITHNLLATGIRDYISSI